MVSSVYQVVGHGNALAVLLGAVDGNICFAFDVEGQDDRVKLGPAAPVGRWECVEVSLERDFFTSGNRQRSAVGPAQALAVLFRFDDVQHADIKGLATLWQ